MNLTETFVDDVIRRAMGGHGVTRVEVLALCLLWDCQEPVKPDPTPTQEPPVKTR